MLISLLLSNFCLFLYDMRENGVINRKTIDSVQLFD